MNKWSAPSDVQKVFSPANWGYSVSNAEKSYLASCPTLMQFDALYGHGNASLWVEIQISAMFGASSNKDEGLIDGIRIFSQTFAAQVKTFKLSELLLFFGRYKAGKYDNSYHTFDTRRIGAAFFKEFLPERNAELAAIDRKEEQERIEKRRFTPPNGYTCLQWYNELKQRAAAGDQEAIKLLNTPPQ